jgi:hypothetical protein
VQWILNGAYRSSPVQDWVVWTLEYGCRRESLAVLGKSHRECSSWACRDGGTYRIQDRILVACLPDVHRALADKIEEGVGLAAAGQRLDLAELDTNPFSLYALVACAELDGALDRGLHALGAGGDAGVS